MTFDELKLCIAIRNAGLGGGDIFSERERFGMIADVMRCWLFEYKSSVFPFSVEEVDRLRLTYRKNENTKMKIEVAVAHGTRCFWEGRGKGECSNEVDCGHILPRSQGGALSVENCMIECSRHNRQRGTMSIESYISSERNADLVLSEQRVS